MYIYYIIYLPGRAGEREEGTCRPGREKRHIITPKMLILFWIFNIILYIYNIENQGFTFIKPSSLLLLCVAFPCLVDRSPPLFPRPGPASPAGPAQPGQA